MKIVFNIVVSKIGISNRNGNFDSGILNKHGVRLNITQSAISYL